MSQPYRTNPSFNFLHVDVTGCDNQADQFQDTSFQQWIYPGTRTPMNSVPSPTNTVHTVRTAPLPTTANRTGSQRTAHADAAEYESIDPNLHNYGYLAPPETRSFTNIRSHGEQIADPLTRFYQGDGPWDPMRNFNANTTGNTFSPSKGNIGPYRQGPCSDVESTVPRSDSGYYTRSVLSNEPSHVNQDLLSEVILRASTLNVQSESQRMVRLASDQRSVSQQSNRSGNQRQELLCPEANCFTVSKCPSDQKKHMLKHLKQFVCEQAGCKRAGQGFATVNDLDRHKKSVHKIGITNTKSWLCAAESCKDKVKIWPRLDNFKQHIERMHKDEDEDDLIKRSEHYPREPSPAAPPSFVDPAYLLAGMGSENSLATGHSPNSTLSINMHNFAYPQFVSFSGNSISDASKLSPGTNSLETSIPQPSTSPFDKTATDQIITPSAESLLGARSQRRQPPRVLSAKTVTRSTSKLAQDRSPALQLPLSSPPQTKSEQQQALQKLSKANINIEELVLRVLGEQQLQGGSEGDLNVTLSDSDRLQASQAIADLVKQKTRPTSSSVRRTAHGSSSVTQLCPYKDCGFNGRICDLNKHVKRHRKPYGCTYPKCHKRFGAKSDWKRHENSQHFQQETFRCDFSSGLGQQCGQHFYRTVQFRNHVELEHRVTLQDKVKDALDRCKIGKNCQGSYWCGFCCEIKMLKHVSNEAWDERFDHIADHFEKGDPKKCIDDWICVEENKTKKQLHEDMRLAKQKFSTDDEIPVAAEKPASALSNSPPSGSRKRSLSPCVVDSRAATRRKKTVTTVIFCCICGYNGATDLQGSCMECQHIFCVSCRGETVRHLSY